MIAVVSRSIGATIATELSNRNGVVSKANRCVWAVMKLGLWRKKNGGCGSIETGGCPPNTAFIVAI